MAALTYSPRVVDAELAARLQAFGGVVLEGPKACGKTLTARRAAASEVLLDVDRSARAAVDLDPSLVLTGPAPRLLDEWQVVPQLWNHVRRTIDERGLPGQFILTGSAVPADDVTRHTGAGRITRIRMRPMSLFESGLSTGAVSLTDLLDGNPARAADPQISTGRLVDAICVGGWPALQSLPVEDALTAVTGYLDEIRRTDINRVDRRRRDPTRVGRLLRALARNVATEAALTKLAADADAGDGGPARGTVYDHLAALERLMVIEDQPAWQPHLRSRARLRTTATRHFVDPSLAVAALGASPGRLLADLNYLGLLFESLVIRDLRIYGQSLNAEVLHYRDSSGLEIDAIVESRDGRWGAFEVKLGGERAIGDAAASLRRFAERIDPARSGRPAVLGVLVGGGYAYTRDDGVAVVPITTLAP